MTHQLTDEICDALWDEHGQYYALYEEVRLTCRAAYDKGAADRLEQVFEWIKENLSDDYYGLVNGDEVLSDLKKAMYPQLEILGFLGDLVDQEES